MRTSPVPFSFSGIEVIDGMFGGGAVCAKLRVPPSAVMPAVAQAARPRKRRRPWSDVVMATFLIRGYVSCSPAPDPENGVGIHATQSFNIRDLSVGVNAGVCAPRTGDLKLMIEQLLMSRLEFALNRSHLRLNLPAMEVRAVVCQSQLEVPHSIGYSM